jgi:hypothetical protein
VEVEEPSAPEISLASLVLPILRALTVCSPRVGVELSARIWDVVVFEGDSAMIRAAVTVLARLEGRLYGDRTGILKELAVDEEVEEAWSVGDVEEFIGVMREMGKVEGEA